MKNLRLHYLIFFILMSACQESSELSDLNEASDVIREKRTLTASFCTPDTKTNNVLNYYLFIIDSSSTNQDNDPSKSIRLNSINSFLSSNVHNSKDRYQLITFKDSADLADEDQNIQLDEQTADNYDGSYESLFLDKDKFINTALEAFKDQSNQGNSNLEDAISVANKLIIHQENVENYRRNILGNSTPYSLINYKIFLLTDGIPTTADGEEVVDTTQIENAVTNSLKNLPEDTELNTISSLEIYTGLYHNIDLSTGEINCVTYDGSDAALQAYCEAKDLLKEIATTDDKNNKYFSELSAGGFFKFENYLPLSFTPLKNLIFYNIELPGLHWSPITRKFEKDSDLDGLSDELEYMLGSNPFKKDTDMDGLSDGVQYMQGQVCSLENCADASDTVYAGCFRDENNQFPDTDQDGLNDCEEHLLNSKADSSDSNFNYLSDSQMIRLGFSPSLSHPLWSQDDNDEFTFEQEIKKFTPIKINNVLLVDKPPQPIYKLLIDEKTTADESKCYNLTVKDLPITTDRTEVWLNLVFQDRLQKNPVLHRQAKRNFKYGEKMHFEAADFKNILP